MSFADAFFGSKKERRRRDGRERQERGGEKRFYLCMKFAQLMSGGILGSYPSREMARWRVTEG